MNVSMPTNSFDGEMLKRYLGAIDESDDELLDLKVEHLNACKPIRARIKNTMKEARNAGLNMESFRALVAKHRSERKIEQRIAELEADAAADLAEMKRSMGVLADTPLGQAALERAAQQHGGDALDSLGA